MDEFQILWECGSEEELRLKAAALGIDAEAWLEANGFMWRQSFMWANPGLQWERAAWGIWGRPHVSGNRL